MAAKRFWCLDEYKGETSPIVDEKFAPTNEWLCNKLNELYEEKEQLLSDKEHLMGYLIRFCSFDDDDLDYIMSRESNREYGKQYYEMKEEDW